VNYNSKRSSLVMVVLFIAFFVIFAVRSHTFSPPTDSSDVRYWNYMHYTGDGMTGDLDMNQNDILDVNRIDVDTVGGPGTTTSDTIDVTTIYTDTLILNGVKITDLEGSNLSVTTTVLNASGGGGGWNLTDSLGRWVGWGGVVVTLAGDTVYIRFEGSSDFDTSGGVVSLAADRIDSTHIKSGAISLPSDLAIFTEAELEGRLSDVTALFTNNVTGDVTVSGGTSTLGANTVETGNIVDQTITLDDIDTSSTFVVGEMYHGTSADPTERYATAQILSDSLALALLKSGGTMVGGATINMNNGHIIGGNFYQTDTMVIGNDTSYADHILAYLVRLEVHNATGQTLDMGTPVYISGATGDLPNADSARADNAAMMPAIGLIEHDITNGSGGYVLFNGKMGGLNTNGLSEGDPVYVAPTGGWTTTKPTGTDLIQKIGEVTRVNVSQGDIYIFGAGRTNDIPNVATIIGNWINTNYPWADDEVADNITASNYLLSSVFPDSSYWKIDTDTIYYLHSNGDTLIRIEIDDGNDAVTMRVDNRLSFKVLADTVGEPGKTTCDTLDVINIIPDTVMISDDKITDFLGDHLALTGSTIGVENDFLLNDGDVGTGVFDFGGATSLEIPNGTAPAPTNEGEIFQDTDDDMLEGTDGTDDFIFSERYKTFLFEIDNPELLECDTIKIPIRGRYPGGIIIDSIGVMTSTSTSYSCDFEEWTNMDHSSGSESAIATVATSTSFEAASGSIAHTIEYGNIIAVDLPADDIRQVTIWIRFEVLGND